MFIELINLKAYKFIFLIFLDFEQFTRNINTFQLIHLILFTPMGTQFMIRTIEYSDINDQRKKI